MCQAASVTPRAVARQAPLSMGFSRQEYWSGLPCPPPGDLPNPGIKPTSFTSLMSPALAGEFFSASVTWEARGTVRIRFKTCVYQKICKDIDKELPVLSSASLTQFHSPRRQRESEGETIKRSTSLSPSLGYSIRRHQRVLCCPALRWCQ